MPGGWRLSVVQTGRLKDPAVAALRDEYLTRFRRFGKLDVIEREPKGDAPLWPAGVGWKVALDERGDAPDSPGLARLVERWCSGHGAVAFLIGEAYGHHQPSLALADARLSLGRITLPHRLAHLVLIEQLYRAATIVAGTGYHH
jgi:23S rRNA (pseudouridine1915-N3)-methyltransferase